MTDIYPLAGGNIGIIKDPLGVAVAQKPPSFKVEIEKLLKAGAIANYDRLIALIIKTNDQNHLKAEQVFAAGE